LTDREAGRYGFEISAYQMDAGPFLGWAVADGAQFQDRAGTRALFNETFPHTDRNWGPKATVGVGLGPRNQPVRTLEFSG